MNRWLSDNQITLIILISTAIICVMIFKFYKSSHQGNVVLDTRALSFKNEYLVIPPKFDNARFFFKGYAAVELNKKWGIIDKTGHFVIQPIYDEIGIINYGFGGNFANNNIRIFSEDVVPVKMGKKWGFVNKNGKLLIKPAYDDYKGFIQGYAIIEVKNKWGVVDKRGKTIIKPEYDSINNFHEGVFAVEVKDKWGFVDKSGKVIIKPIYKDVLFFNDGIAPVMSGNHWDLINLKGKVVKKSLVEKPFHYRIQVSLNDLNLKTYKCNPIDKWRVVFEGTQMMRESFTFYNFDLSYIETVNSFCKTHNNLEGLDIKPSFTFERDPEINDSNGIEYDQLPISEGYRVVWKKTNGKRGLLDANLKWVILPIFDDAERFSEGYAAVKLNGKWGYISKERLDKYRQN